MALPFLVYAPCVGSSVTPGSLPDSGGSVVLSGSGFVLTENLMVRIRSGESSVPVTPIWIDSTKLSFSMSDVAGVLSGSFHVEVAINGQQFVDTGQTLLIYSEPVITRCVPASGPISGGTSIILEGSDIVDTGSDARVRLGGTWIVAVAYESATRLTFTTPNVPTPMNVSVEFAPNGVQYLKTSAWLLLFSRPAPTIALPGNGPRSGGTRVAVHGSGFVDTGRVKAAFTMTTEGVSYHEVVEAAFISSSTIECVSPALSPGVTAPFTVNVNIALNGIDEANGTATFSYYELPNEYKFSLSPSGGPSVGGTSLQLLQTGLAFVNTTEITVKYSGLLVNGSSFEVAVPGITTTSLGSAIAVHTRQIPVDAQLPQSLQTQLSLNGQQYGTYSASFRVYSTPSITSISPKSGPVGGMTHLLISGSKLGDPATNVLTLRFHDSGVEKTTSDCRFVSDSLLNCTTPSFATTLGQLSLPVAASVSLSFNDQQWSFSPVPFTIYTVPSISALSPSSSDTKGNTVIDLIGSGFVNTNEIVARIRHGSALLATVSTQYVSATRVRLVLPDLSSLLSIGDVAVDVALNGQQFDTQERTLIIYSSPLIDSVVPLSGPAKFDSTSVTISGSNITHTFDARVRIVDGSMSTSVAGTWVSSTSLSALLPPLPWAHNSTLPRTVMLSVALDGQNYVGSIPFVYFDEAVIYSVSPKLDAAIGGELMTVNGTNFVNTTEIDVVFIHDSPAVVLKASDVTFVSSSELTCRIPNLRSDAALASVLLPRTVTVEVRMNGQPNSQSSGGPTFQYVEDCELHSVEPDCGPIVGGTDVTVTGKNLGISGESINCRFVVGSSTFDTTGTVQSDTEAKCPTPTSIGLAGPELMYQASISVSKRQSSGFVQAVPFAFYLEPQIHSIAPNSSMTAGRSTSVVKGDRFSNTSTIRCRFDQAISTGTYISSTQIDCPIPAHVALNRDPWHVLVAVSLNGGQNWHVTSKSVFSYLPCSGGTFAKQYTDACEPCAAGTYAPWPGAVECLECPLDHYCPQQTIDAIPCVSKALNTRSPKRSEKLTDCTCKLDYYQPDPIESQRSGKSCQVCPQGAVCTGDTTRPYAKAGFWNSHQGADYTFFQCPAGNVACKGGQNVTSWCLPGYEARMCSQCSTSYYKLEDLCIKCPENAVWSLVLGAIAFLALVFVLKRFGGLHQSGGALSVAVSYIQVTSLFADFRLDWAEEILDFLSRLSFMNLNLDIAAPECSMEYWNYSYRFGFTMFLPLIALLVVLLWHGLSVLHYTMVHKWGLGDRVNKAVGQETVDRKRGLSLATSTRMRRLESIATATRKWATEAEDPASSFRGAINAFLMMLSLLYIILSSKALEPFDCTAIAGGKYSLDAFPEMLCWEGEHMQIVPWAIVCSVIYVLGIPVLFLTILFRNRKKVRDPSATTFRRTCGAIYGRFSTEWFWWETVVMLRKIAMVLVKLNLTNYPLIQGAFGMVLILLALSLHMYARPFAKKGLNRLESGLLFCNFLVLLTGLMFHDNKFQTDALREATKVVTILLLALSLAGILLFVLLEMKATWTVFRSKSAAKKLFGDSKAWQYWQMHLPSSSLPALQKWMEHADRKDIDALERLTEEIQSKSVESDVAESVMDVTYKSRRDLQHLLLLLSAMVNDEGKLLLNFIHTIRQTEKRSRGSRLRRWLSHRSPEQETIELDTVGDSVNLDVMVESSDKSRTFKSASQICPHVEEEEQETTEEDPVAGKTETIEVISSRPHAGTIYLCM